MSKMTLTYGVEKTRMRTSRIFFIYITPSGMEGPLHECTSLRRDTIQSRDGFNGTTDIKIAQYSVLSPTRIKMVNMQTCYGEAGGQIRVVLDLNPKFPMIHLDGLGEFGMFVGPAKVDYSCSASYPRIGEPRQLTLPMAKKAFNIRLVAPAATAVPASGRSRRLIIG